MKPLRSVVTALTLCLSVLGATTGHAADDTTLTITDESFGCVNTMTPVRGFFVDNLAGDLEATLAVATSETGGAYPAGSVVQLVPTEVMVKHPKGTNATTNDWEFF